MILRLVILLSTIILVFLSTKGDTASVIPKNGPCNPGELVWVDCNLCTCNAVGIPNPVCANMWCQPTPALKEAKAKELQQQQQQEQQNQEVNVAVETKKK